MVENLADMIGNRTLIPVSERRILIVGAFNNKLALY